MFPWTTLLLILTAALTVYAVLVAVGAYRFYQPAQTLRCPETGKPVRVQLDATLAALTAVTGPPQLLVTECELWPERKGCEQRCTRIEA